MVSSSSLAVLLSVFSLWIRASAAMPPFLNRQLEKAKNRYYTDLHLRHGYLFPTEEVEIDDSFTVPPTMPSTTMPDIDRIVARGSILDDIFTRERFGIGRYLHKRSHGPVIAKRTEKPWRQPMPTLPPHARQ